MDFGEASLAGSLTASAVGFLFQIAGLHLAELRPAGEHVCLTSGGIEGRGQKVDCFLHSEVVFFLVR